MQPCDVYRVCSYELYIVNLSAFLKIVSRAAIIRWSRRDNNSAQRRFREKEDEIHAIGITGSMLPCFEESTEIVLLYCLLLKLLVRSPTLNFGVDPVHVSGVACNSRECGDTPSNPAWSFFIVSYHVTYCQYHVTSCYYILAGRTTLEQRTCFSLMILNVFCTMDYGHIFWTTIYSRITSIRYTPPPRLQDYARTEIPEITEIGTGTSETETGRICPDLSGK